MNSSESCYGHHHFLNLSRVAFFIFDTSGALKQNTDSPKLLCSGLQGNMLLAAISAVLPALNMTTLHKNIFTCRRAELKRNSSPAGKQTAFRFPRSEKPLPTPPFPLKSLDKAPLYSFWENLLKQLRSCNSWLTFVEWNSTLRFWVEINSTGEIGISVESSSLLQYHVGHFKCRLLRPLKSHVL